MPSQPELPSRGVPRLLRGDPPREPQVRPQTHGGADRRLDPNAPHARVKSRRSALKRAGRRSDGPGAPRRELRPDQINCTANGSRALREKPRPASSRAENPRNATIQVREPNSSRQWTAPAIEPKPALPAAAHRAPA